LNIISQSFYTFEAPGRFLRFILHVRCDASKNHAPQMGELSANKENKVLYEARLKYLRDQLSNIRGEHRLGREEGIKEGIKQGIEQGRDAEKRDVIQRMLKKGMDAEAEAVAE